MLITIIDYSPLLLTLKCLVNNNLYSACPSLFIVLLVFLPFSSLTYELPSTSVFMEKSSMYILLNLFFKGGRILDNFHFWANYSFNKDLF